MDQIDMKDFNMGREKVAVNVYEGKKGFSSRLKRFENKKINLGNLKHKSKSNRFIKKKRRYSGNLSPNDLPTINE